MDPPITSTVSSCPWPRCCMSTRLYRRWPPHTHRRSWGMLPALQVTSAQRHPPQSPVTRQWCVSHLLCPCWTGSTQLMMWVGGLLPPALSCPTVKWAECCWRCWRNPREIWTQDLVQMDEDQSLVLQPNSSYIISSCLWFFLSAEVSRDQQGNWGAVFAACSQLHTGLHRPRPH